jgi:hypothetical protein
MSQSTDEIMALADEVFVHTGAVAARKFWEIAKYVEALEADAKELLAIFIEGGYAEEGDGPLLDRLHNYGNGVTQ